MARIEDETTVDAVAAALRQFDATLAARDVSSLDNFANFAALNSVQQLVLSDYDAEVLEPRRAVWHSAIQKLAEGPYTGWNANNGTLWWEFESKGVENLHGERPAHVTVRIDAEIPESDETRAAMTLVRNLNGHYMMENEVKDASRHVGIPLPQSYVARKLHREPKKDPSREAQHQAAGEALLQHATELTATVYATPAGGKRERILYTSINAGSIVRPSAIMARFARPRGRFGDQLVELTEGNTQRFLEGWREDPLIRSEKPDMESLDTFLRNQLTWGGDFSAFNSVLTTLRDCSLRTTIGKPQFTPRQRRSGAA
jgi:hypothetical protein